MEPQFERHLMIVAVVVGGAGHEFDIVTLHPMFAPSLNHTLSTAIFSRVQFYPEIQHRTANNVEGVA